MLRYGNRAIDGIYSCNRDLLEQHNARMMTMEDFLGQVEVLLVSQIRLCVAFLLLAHNACAQRRVQRNLVSRVA